MKKKNLALTKRVVSFITAVCLSLSSTIMVLPASAYTDAAPATIAANGQCNESGCAGTYLWVEEEEGNHVLKCNGDTVHIYDGYTHVSGAEENHGCTLCTSSGENPVAEYTVTFDDDDIDSNTISVTNGEGEKVNSGDKVKATDTLNIKATYDEGYEFVQWTVIGGTVTNAKQAETTVTSLTGNVEIKAEFKNVSDPAGDPEGVKVEFTGTSSNGSYTVQYNDGSTFTSGTSTGQSLTIVPNANAGYVVETVKYTTAGGDTIVEPVEGKYTITPSSDVTAITVTFKAVEYNVTITEPDVSGCTVNVKKGTDIVNDGGKVTVEDTLTLSVEYGSKIEFVKWNIKNATILNDKTVSDNSITVKPDGNGDVKISAEFVLVYGVTAATVDGGTIALTADKYSYAENDDVTFTVKAKDEYTLKVNSVKVLKSEDSTETDIAVTESNGQYTFKMPAYGVKITAEFVKKTYTVTIDTNVPSSTITVVYGDSNTPVVSGTTSLEKGTTVKITEINGDDGYVVDTVKVTKDGVTGDDANVTVTTNEVSGDREFTIPDSNVTITVTFGEAKSEYPVTIDSSIDSTKGSVTANSTTVKEGDTVTLTVTPVSGYELVAGSLKVTYTDVDAQPKTIVPVVDPQDATKYTFTMPCNEVTITAEFEEQKTYTVSITSLGSIGDVTATYGDDNDTVISGTTKLAAGTVVKVAPMVNPSSGYQVTGVKYNNNNATKGEDGSYTFKMPAEAVNITVVVGSIVVNHKVNITTVNGNGSTVVTAYTGEDGNDVYDADAGVAKETKITIKVTNTSTDKVIDKVTYKYNDGEAQTLTADSNGNYVFTMPDYDVTVEVSFVANSQSQKYNVSSSVLGGGNIAPYEGKTFEDCSLNETVKFTVTPYDNYTLKKGSVKVFYGDTVLPLTEPTDDAPYYSFSMPAHSVTINATFIAKVDWNDNNDGSYTITTVEGSANGEAYNDLVIPLNTLLKNGITAADIVSFTADYALDTEYNEWGYVGGQFGIGADGYKDNWATISYPTQTGEGDSAVNNPSDSLTFTIDGTKITGNELRIQVHWANATSKLTISNIKANTTAYDVKIDEAIANGTVTAPATAQYGEEVTLTVKPANNYKLKSINVTYVPANDDSIANPVEVSVTDNKFIMPKGHVTVTAEFEKISSIFTVTIGETASTEKLDTWADVMNYIKTNGSADKAVEITVNGEYTLTSKDKLPEAKYAKMLVIDGEGTLKLNTTALTLNTDTIIDGVKLVNANTANKTTGIQPKVNITVAAGKTFGLSSNEYNDIFGKVTGKATSKFVVASTVTVDQIATFETISGNEGIIIVNGNVSGVKNLDGSIRLVNTLTGTKATTVAFDNIANNSTIQLVANADGTLPKVTIKAAEAAKVDEGVVKKIATIKVVDAEGKPVNLTSGTIVAYTAGADISNNIAIYNTDGENPLTAYYYSKTKAIKAEFGGTMTLKYYDEAKEGTVVKNYPNLDLALAAMNSATGYVLTLNEDVTVTTATFAVPKEITGLEINAKEDSGAKLKFTGTKINVVKTLNLNLPIAVEKSKTNKNGTIDVTVSANQQFILDNNFSGNCINKVTGNKTAVFKVYSDVTIGQIATFGTVYVKNSDVAPLLTINGNVSGVVDFYGGMTVSGAKSKVAVTNVYGESKINLVQANNAIPALTITDIKDIENVVKNTGKLTLTVVDDNGTPVKLASGTTVATIKANSKGSTADVVNSKITIGNADTNSKQLSAIYYTKGNAVKAEYKEAITLIYGTKSDDNPGKYFPNLEKVLEDINKKNNENLTSATDVTITINSDVTAASNFTLPKNNNIKSLTFNGTGTLTFTGTKLTVNNDTTFNVPVVANNKAQLIDITVSSNKNKPIVLTINENCLVPEDDGYTSYFGKLNGNVGATLVIDYGDEDYVDQTAIGVAGLSKFDSVTGGIYLYDGKMASIGTFAGFLFVEGAKSSVDITTIKDYHADEEEYTCIYLIENSNTIPKVTIKSIEGEWLDFTVIAYDATTDKYDEINLESGRTILYTKDNKTFTEKMAKKVFIWNNAVEDEDEANTYNATMTAVYDSKTRTIKAVDAAAINLQVYNKETNKYEDIPEGKGKFASLEEAVAYIEKAADSTAVYGINVVSSVEVAKVALPKAGTAAGIDIICADGAVINIGKTASITANTNIGLTNAKFKTTAKTLTLTATKGNVVLNGGTTITAFKGNNNYTMFVYGYSYSNCYDVTGFGTLEAVTSQNDDGKTDEDEDNVDAAAVEFVNTILDNAGSNARTVHTIPGFIMINSTLSVNKVVIDDSSALLVMGTLKSGSFKEFKSGLNSSFGYANPGKNALKFNGKTADDFDVHNDGLYIAGPEYGQKILTTKVIKDLSIFKDATFDYDNATSEDIMPKFTQVGNDIVYLRETFALTSSKAADTTTYFSRWEDAVAAINDANAPTADYTIKVRENFDYHSTIKFPNKGKYNSLTIDGGCEYNGNTNNREFFFTGSLSLTGKTIFKNINVHSTKQVKGVWDTNSFTITGGGYDVVFDNVSTNFVTFNGVKNLTATDGYIGADKITITDTLTTTNCNLRALKGVTTKNWVLGSDTDVEIGNNSKITVSAKLSRPEDKDYVLSVNVLDKTGSTAATTFTKNYSIGSVKTGYELVELANDGYTLKVTNVKNGTLTVVAKETVVLKEGWNLTKDSSGNITKITLVLNANSDKTEIGKAYLPVAQVLAKGKTKADVTGFTCDIKYKNSTGANGCVGIGNNVTDKEHQWGTWTTISWSKENFEEKLLDGIHSSQDNLSFEVWWIDGAEEIEFSNFAFTYKS